MKHSILILVFLTACFTASPALAGDFTAVKHGDWKDPATWGLAGLPCDLVLPGMVAGRADLVTIPPGIVVNFEGSVLPPAPPGIVGQYVPAGKSPQEVEIEGIGVWGRVRGRSTSAPIKLKANGDIDVEETGHVGGSPSSTSKNSVNLEAGGKVTIKGRVTGEYGKVSIKAGGDIQIGVAGTGGTSGARVEVTKSSAEIRSTGGKVTVADSNEVKARGDVSLRAGAGKEARVDGTVKSEKGDIHINGGTPTEKNPGNVVIGARGMLEAPNGEVYIKADTLRIQGKIKARTVQKTCNVLIIEPGGSIEAAKSTKNKILSEKKVEPRNGAVTPAEKGGKSKSSTGDDGRFAFSFADGTVLEGIEDVRICGGVGSVLDLTGNPAGTPVIVCPGLIEVFVDQILLDPGVTLADLCGPGAAVSGPPLPDVDVACVSYGDTVGYPGYPLEVRFQVTNMGFAAEMFELTWEDSLGWVAPPPSAVFLSGSGDEADTLITCPFDPPPWAIPDEDTNSLRLTVRSLSEPTRWYTESVRIPVWGESELRDLNVALWSMTPARTGLPLVIEHWVANNGRIDDDCFVSVNDREGWPLMPYNPDLFVPIATDVTVMSHWEVPTGLPDGFENEIYITVASVATPSVSCTDTVTVVVRNLSAVDMPPPRPKTIQHKCFPSPFNPRVEIAFSLPEADTQVRVTVHDLGGRRIATLHDGPLAGREGRLSWNGRSADGRAMASGVYIYRIAAGGQVATGKMIMDR